MVYLFPRCGMRLIISAEALTCDFRSIGDVDVDVHFPSLLLSSSHKDITDLNK